jgi:sorbitol-specific phosphotransferase system component IIC
VLSILVHRCWFDTACSSFVEENASACHSERSEESPHLKAQSVRKNAGILRFAQNDRESGYPLRMTAIAYEIQAVLVNLLDGLNNVIHVLTLGQ